jgi:hypothetical protein
MGNKHYLEVFKYIFNAFLSSPKDFFERSIYEFKNKDIAVNGENPKLFAYHCNALWLEQINSSNLAV